MAFYGWPISQCQYALTENPLLNQLNSGIRILDIRLSIIDGKLIAYHGIYPERTPFTSILATLYQFLLSPSSNGRRETIVVSIKQEDTASELFGTLVHSEIAASEGGNDLWYTDTNRIPTLGEVRGRCVLFSRFGPSSGPGIGIHPDRWPDSEKEGFTWMCGDTTVRVSDWCVIFSPCLLLHLSSIIKNRYAIPSFLSIPEKVELSTAILLPPPSSSLNAPIPAPSPSLSITFFSAASVPLALPSTVALGFGWPQFGAGVVGVNDRVGKWLLSTFTGNSSKVKQTSRSHSRLFGLRKAAGSHEKLTERSGEQQESDPRVRGWAFIDFFQQPVEANIVPLLIECNFKGRKSGEEGWA